MKHVHTLRLEILETRQLLSTVHAAVAHPAQAIAAPLVLNGTLTVDNRPDASSTAMNADSSTTTSVPVAGQLGALGQVRGFWNQTTDTYGDLENPDTLRLRSSKGTFTVAFNNVVPSASPAKGRGALSYEHVQRAIGGSGAYVGESELGMIRVTSNAARTQVDSLTLYTQNT